MNRRLLFLSTAKAAFASAVGGSLFGASAMRAAAQEVRPRRVAEGGGAHDVEAAWNSFCDVMREAGQEVLRQAPPDDRVRAEGFRFLSRLVRWGFERAFELGTPEAPRVESTYAHRTSFGQRNPDQVYLWGRLRGDYEYRLTVERGSHGVISFVTRVGESGDPQSQG